MGMLFSKSTEETQTRRFDCPDDLEREILRFVYSAGEEWKPKITEARDLVLDKKTPFSTWLASIDSDKMQSICRTAHFVHSIVVAYTGKIKFKLTDEPGRNVVFRIVLAAIEIRTREIIFVDKVRETKSIEYGLAVFAARPEIAEEILTDRLRLESLNQK